MIVDFYTQKTKVFLAETSSDAKPLWNNLKNVLTKAGMEVVLIDNISYLSENQIVKKTKETLKTVDCSIHLLGKKYDEKSTHITTFEHQFNEAKNLSQHNYKDFKMFIWDPNVINYNNFDKQQIDFINSVRYGIFSNMIFSRKESTVLFVEEIRSVITTGKKDKFVINNNDIFFIYNELDEDYALSIIDLLNDIANLEKLSIIMSENIDYSELIIQQIRKTKLAVIYFKRTANWAKPFIQQVWKKTGGASSKTPILFIGDSEFKNNTNIEFNAPNVQTKIVENELIPLEIKIFYDKLETEIVI